VRIEVNSKVVEYLPLSEDIVKEYRTSDEETDYNIVRISEGCVFVEKADCRDHICISQGKKNQIGDTIICLPHRFVATIVSGEDVYE